MIDFTLTDEQKQLQQLARDFTRKEIIPIAAEYDQKEELPWQVVEKAFEVGLLNIAIPEHAGGLGLGMLDECIIGEELAYGCMGIYTVLMASELGITPILVGGTEEQQKRFLTPLTEKPSLAAFALSEPNNGSDAAAMGTTAVLDGDEWVINGTKMWISNGGVADITVVFATTDRQGGHRATVALVVPKDAPGFSWNKIKHKMGQRASLTSELVFENVRVPKENQLGGLGDGFKIAMKTLDKTRVPVAAGSVGVARRALEESLKYAKQREAFGKPIADFQAIQFKLANMAMGIETGRLVTWKAAWLVDQGLPHGVESAIAKAYCSEMAFDAANEAIQVHGGYGYVGEYPVEKLLRDVKLNQIYEGTNEIQRVVISRSLLR
ncbi:acyl-CoA dehydrogenase [Deinococcus metallilatus]|uniref:Acyl-CoA dehydrogenase n=1 Tax=Deinococcus metallilatus TaxID=1211322 RepID=A0AAJ5JXA6_9DEIO|nr:acyl-CoA dehydrogenase family protein [Deinococcus metallilatus]MBB5295324.1 acyl-CoA dehydrogenase [Deinococcus metallilatus]QBY08522.1 acyl-CoA dehydrogenase [Deinococcus metallilatus]RXJ11032.1 acyl-CoA dehydrogenase [Deinococcus metallilatus]TLK21590.1 acyl-CoA dehydrogenase [Deinococcus metallilatus]GMA15099.1 acyl-CoA dehydrogenase [Deinococcus metallilatus]